MSIVHKKFLGLMHSITNHSECVIVCRAQLDQGSKAITYPSVLHTAPSPIPICLQTAIGQNSRQHTTCRVVSNQWLEWTVGLGGQLSVEALDER